MNAKWYVLLIISSLFFGKQANGQYLSAKGFFELDQQLGCSDLTVNITSLVPDVITFQYNGASSPTNDNPFFTYTEPGSYWINQYHQGPSGNERKDSILVTVVIPEVPEIQLFSCNSLELVVQLNDNYYDEYEINYGDGTIIIIPAGNTIPPHTYGSNAQQTVSVTGLFTTATNRCGVTSIVFNPLAQVLPAQLDSLVTFDNKSVKVNYQLPPNSVNKLEVSLNNNSSFVLFKSLDQSTSVDSLLNLNLSQSTYCFRIATYDACSNFKSYSNEICSVNLSTSAQNNQITINWNSFDYGAGQTTSLNRDGSLLQSFGSPITQHIDTTVVCNTTYCYQALIEFPGGGISKSLSACELAFSSDIPPTIDNTSNTSYQDSIEWQWQVPSSTLPSYYTVHQVSEGGNIINSDSVPTNLYKTQFDNTVQYIAVQVHDICNNVSPIGNVGSSILLEGIINSSSDIELNWNNYLGWVDGFQEYYLTIKDKNGNLLDSISTGGNTFYTLLLADQEEQSISFTVWVIPVINELNYSQSNIITIERAPIIGIPNSFTPNGDGLNDKFIISGKFIESYEMQIFNRWGEALFQTTDLDNGWDGTSKGNKMITGNYTYWIRIKDLNNNEHIRTGSILILSN